jgi:hypothetical protein
MLPQQALVNAIRFLKEHGLVDLHDVTIVVDGDDACKSALEEAFPGIIVKLCSSADRPPTAVASA